MISKGQQREGVGEMKMSSRAENEDCGEQEEKNIMEKEDDKQCPVGRRGAGGRDENVIEGKE